MLQVWPSGNRGLLPGRGKTVISSTAFRLALGFSQLAIQRNTWSLSPQAKRPELQANHSPPSSDEAMNMWSYTSIPQIFSWRRV
jgi:hypothetical protein